LVREKRRGEQATTNSVKTLPSGFSEGFFNTKGERSKKSFGGRKARNRKTKR